MQLSRHAEESSNSGAWAAPDKIIFGGRESKLYAVCGY
jgi:hypothetical protein